MTRVTTRAISSLHIDAFAPVLHVCDRKVPAAQRVLATCSLLQGGPKSKLLPKH